MKKKETKEVVATEEKEQENTDFKSNFEYYKLQLKLTSEQLGTCTEASLYEQHILKKSQKMITEAHRLANRAKKAYEKYLGVDLPPQKEIQELQGVMRRYQEVLGKKEEIPSGAEELFEYIEKLKEEYDEKVALGEELKATCFMRSPSGHSCISTHMLLGNLKANCKTIVNAGDKSNLTSKVSVQEIMSLDVKPVEKFVEPSLDILRLPDGRPKLCERSVRFDHMGKQVVALIQSEIIPEGAEYTMHLRVRKNSPMTEAFLWKLLDLGKNTGLGQWRGSGSKGQFVFRLEKLTDYKENIPEGWN
jgi:hypothetical protein